MKKVFNILLFLTIAVFLLIFNSFLKNTSFLSDENTHFLTTREIAEWEINEGTFSRNAQIPTYYFLSAFFYKYFNFKTISALRYLQTIFSFLAILTFYIIANKISPKNAPIKTLQFLTFPYITYVSVLFYNDMFSILFLLLTFLTLINKKYLLSGILGLFSILIRQNNIIWLAFFATYHYFSSYGLPLNKSKIITFLKNISLYIIGFILLVIFVITNGSPALADKNANPLTFHIENSVFFLFSFFILFFPLIILKSKEIFIFIKKNYWIIFLIILFFPIYSKLFKVDNIYNIPAYNIYLRNLLLNYFIETPFRKFLFFIPVSLAVFSIPSFKLLNKNYYLLYLFSFVFLSMLWLVESRYLITTFTFFFLFRRNENKIYETLLIAFYLIIDYIIIQGMASGKFLI